MNDRMPKSLYYTSAFLLQRYCNKKEWILSTFLYYTKLQLFQTTTAFLKTYCCQGICKLGVSPNFEITVACGLKFHWYLRTLSLKFQKALTKMEVFLSLPCCLSLFNWDSQQGRDRKTPILLVAFWNLKLKVLKLPQKL